MKIKLVSYATVMVIEERIAKKHVRGAGANAVFKERSEGFYAKFTEWPGSAFLGNENPGLQAGDRIKITVEKVH